MIHIRHTPAAELARQRIMLAVRSLPCVLLPGIGLVIWAISTPLPLPSGKPDHTFRGIDFIPESAKPEKLPPRVNINLSASAPAHPNPLVPFIPTPELEMFEFPDTEPDYTASNPFESDAASLIPPTPEPIQSAPQRRTSKPPVADSGYTPPSYLDCPQPDYPARLRQRRLAGVVDVRIAVSAEGEPTQVDITQSSGSAQLDRHARNWILRHWRFTPARRNNTPTASLVDTSIQFTLHSS